MIKNQGDARILGAGFGLLSLLITVSIIFYLYKQMAPTMVGSNGALNYAQKVVGNANDRTADTDRQIENARGGTASTAGTAAAPTPAPTAGLPSPAAGTASATANTAAAGAAPPTATAPAVTSQPAARPAVPPTGGGAKGTAKRGISGVGTHNDEIDKALQDQ